MLLILLLLAGGYLLMRNDSCSGLTETVAKFATGGLLDPNQFKKASVYEGLEDNNQKNPLPERVSLRRFAPRALDQGKQGSCVAWSSAYAARSILESASTSTDPNQVAYSPAFMYNQIGLDGCQGSYLIRAMEFMTKKGAVPFNDFPYNENDCRRAASGQLSQEALQHRMHGFNRLTEGDGVSALNLRAIKEHLAKDAPVVIGMMVGNSFMEGMIGKKVWHPSPSDYRQVGFGGHAMCVIGYDDRLEGGAFEIMNSWGTQWGENGIGYVRYGDFRQFVREAYGVDPMPKRGQALNRNFDISIGLVNNDNRQYIPLQVSSGNIFSTLSPVKKGTRFKIEINNSVECYTYIFTPNASGSSFVLFPYKSSHSPYCGITGTRLFPRSESIRADSLGNKDYMAVLVSKTELDYNKINAQINASGQSGFTAKFNDVIRQASIKNGLYRSNGKGNINLFAEAGQPNQVMGCVVEINKQ
jgi:C1A family cysteine protease